MTILAGKFLATTRDWPVSAARLGHLAIALVCLIAVALVVMSYLDDLPDMRKYPEGSERKAAFFDYLRPIVETRNAAILEEREHFLEIAQQVAAGEKLSLIQNHRLESLAERYKVDLEEATQAQLVGTLRRRIDIIPVALALVQAAKESAWGTSKFAREGNNLFGQWCYSQGCGMVPARRSAGARHEVRVFASVCDAVIAYLHNINTGEPYRALRHIRATMRRAGKTPDAVSLADGLLFYSQRREAYVNEVKLMIHQYRRFRVKRGG